MAYCGFTDNILLIGLDKVTAMWYNNQVDRMSKFSTERMLNMAQSRQKNSVEEQRERQRELIELKRQREAFNENPEDYVAQNSESGTVEQTTRSKLENFWYYSKFTIGFILIVAVFLTIGISQCASRVDYDMTIVLYFKTYVDSTMSENIATIAEKYCDDHNKDGKVNVLVVNCSIPEGTATADGDAATRLLGQFQNEEAIVYIVDTGAYEDLAGSFGDDFLDYSLNLPDQNGTAYHLNGTVFDMAFNAVVEDYTNNFDYYIMRRFVGERATANKGDVKKHIGYADRLIRDIVADPLLKDLDSSEIGVTDKGSFGALASKTESTASTDKKQQ